MYSNYYQTIFSENDLVEYHLNIYLTNVKLLNF